MESPLKNSVVLDSFVVSVLQAVVVETAIAAIQSVAWLLMMMGNMPNGFDVLIKEPEAYAGFPLSLLAVRKPGTENKDAGDTEDDDDEENEAAGDEDEEAGEEEGGLEKDGEGEDGGDPEDEPEANGDGDSGEEEEEEEEDEDDDEDDDDDDDDDDDGEDEEEEEEEDEEEEELQPPAKRRK